MIGENSGLVVAGHEVPDALVGPLTDSTTLLGDGEALRHRLEEDGYLLLRGLFEQREVQDAREAVFGRLAAVGEILEPAEDGIASGVSKRHAQVGDLDEFWRSVCEDDALRTVSHGTALHALMADVLGTAAKPFDFVWLRPTPPGRASPLHFDHVYMNRGTQSVVTAWLPLGPVGKEDGPLVIVEGSHRFEDLIARYRGLDVDLDPKTSGSLPEDALTLARARGTRLLTADFKPGDVLLFGMFTLHGSAENVSPEGRVRLTCDVRYQPANEAQDERWFGNPPPGHGGLSYGGLSSAQPLTAAPLVR